LTETKLGTLPGVYLGGIIENQNLAFYVDEVQILIFDDRAELEAWQCP
jgi:hypothetical protein